MKKVIETLRLEAQPGIELKITLNDSGAKIVLYADSEKEVRITVAEVQVILEWYKEKTISLANFMTSALTVSK
ncbi:TPA: hypothetical protein VDU52_001403 [Pseudomonas aeruginosa]|nr:hypothetical protein [Pseudomonas aeruginosa]